MPTPIGISRNFTVSTVTDGITYSIDVSPSSVTIPADETSVSQNFNFYFYKKEGTGAKEAYSCYWAIFKRVGSTYTRLYGGGKATSVTNRSVTVDSTMDSLFIRIGDSSMASASDAFISEQPISITKQGDTGEQGPEGDAAEAYTIVVESAVASVSANGKLNANIVAHVVKTVGSTSSVYPSGLTCKIGKQTVSPQARQADDPYTFIVNNGDWTNTSTYNKASMVVLSFTLNSLVLATSEIPISVVGQMGRNIYFAGEASDLQGTTFQPTDNMAPYVRSIYNGETKYFVYVGESVTGSATKTYPNNSTASGGSTGYSDKSIWERMETTFAYLITKAVFTDFAKLGSAIFNGDFMFSQYGHLGLDPSDSSLYEAVDPTSMMAKTIRDSIVSISVSSTSFSPSLNLIESGTLPAGTYTILVEGTNLTNLDYKVSTGSGTTAPTLTKTTYKSGATKLVFSVTKTNANDYYFFYRKGSGSSTPTITHFGVSTGVFQPNVYVDWFNGFLYAQEGWFRNVTVEGVLNNLITVIKPTNISDKAPKGDVVVDKNGGAVNNVRSLDVLCVGDIIDFQTGTSSDSEFYLPTMFKTCNSEYMHRTLTKSGGTEHFITYDEIRQLVGKKLTIFNHSGQTLYFFIGRQLVPLRNVYYYDNSQNVVSMVYDPIDRNNGSSFREYVPIVNGSMVSFELVMRLVYDNDNSATSQSYNQGIFWEVKALQSGATNIGGTTTFSESTWNSLVPI